MSKRIKPAPPAVKRVAMRYMTEFRCLAADCEDPCCSDWMIPVDRGHYDRIHLTLLRDPALPGPEVLALQPPERRDDAMYAALGLRSDGSCALLGPDRLCSLQARHGESLLPNGCAMYPRSLKRNGAMLELSGELSCPQVSRLALLAEDGTALVAASQAQLGRGSTVQDSHYLSAAELLQLDLIRQTQRRILDAADLPLASRLFCGAFFAGHVTGLLRGKPVDLQAKLQEASARATEPAMMQALHQRLQVGLGQVTGALPLVVGLVGTRIHRGSGAFHRFVAAVWESYAAEAGSGVAAVAETAERLRVALDPAALEPVYLQRRGRVEARFASFLDRVFGHLARHYWMKEWFLDSPSVLMHNHALLLRIAVLRFLLISHPGALAAADSGDEAALGRLLVEVSYSFARVMDHSVPFAEAMRETLRPLVNLGDAVALLKV